MMKTAAYSRFAAQWETAKTDADRGIYVEPSEDGKALYAETQVVRRCNDQGIDCQSIPADRWAMLVKEMVMVLTVLDIFAPVPAPTHRCSHCGIGTDSPDTIIDKGRIVHCGDCYVY